MKYLFNVINKGFNEETECFLVESESKSKVVLREWLEGWYIENGLNEEEISDLLKNWKKGRFGVWYEDGLGDNDYEVILMKKIK